MPHYKSGELARVGDLVRGTGYNVVGEITGKVVQVSEGEECNLAVAHIDHYSPLLLNAQNPKSDTSQGHTQMGYGVIVLPSVEYGACKNFLKITSALLLAVCVVMTIARACEAGIFGRRCRGGACRVQYAPRQQRAPAPRTEAPNKPAPKPEVGPPPDVLSSMAATTRPLLDSEPPPPLW